MRVNAGVTGTVCAAVCLLGVVGAAAAGPQTGLFAAGRNAATIDDSNATIVRTMVNWPEFEPEAGQYDFSFTDSLVGNLQRTGTDIVLTLRSNAPEYVRVDLEAERRSWGGDHYKYSALPSDMSQWLGFVTAMVERYDGDGVDDLEGVTKGVTAYQIENEWIGQWKDTDESFYDFVRQTAAAIRAADPSAIIVGPAVGHWNLRAFALGEGFDPRPSVPTGPNQSPTQLTQQQAANSLRSESGAYQRTMRLFEAVGSEYDVLDLHVYASIVDEVHWWTEWARSTLASKGLAGQKIWSMEFALPLYDYSELSHCRLIPQTLAAAPAAGIERVCYASLYPMSAMAFRQFALNDGQAVRTAYYNYRQAALAMEGATSVRQVANDSARVYEITRADGTVAWVAWSNSGAVVSYDLPLADQGTMYSLIQPESTMTESSSNVRARDGKLRVQLTADPIIVIGASSGSGGDETGKRQITKGEAGKKVNAKKVQRAKQPARIKKK